jgi:hypothetical protein
MDLILFWYEAGLTDDRAASPPHEAPPVRPARRDLPWKPLTARREPGALPGRRSPLSRTAAGAARARRARRA